MGVSWPTLNPTELFNKMADIFPTFRLNQFQRFMKDAGINSGYQVYFLFISELNPNLTIHRKVPNNMGGGHDQAKHIFMKV